MGHLLNGVKKILLKSGIIVALVLLGGCGPYPPYLQSRTATPWEIASPSPQTLEYLAPTPSTANSSAVEPAPAPSTPDLTPLALAPSLTLTTTQTFGQLGVVPSPEASPLANPLLPVVPIEGVLAGEIRGLYAAPNGGLWLWSETGLARWAQNNWQVYLEGFEGKLVGLDENGRAWVLRPNGRQISAWNGSEWQDYSVEQGWSPANLTPGYRLEDLVSDIHGNVWLVTAQGVRTFNGKRWQNITREDFQMPPLTGDGLRSEYHVFRLRHSSNIWVTNCDWNGSVPSGGGGLRWFDGQAWQGKDSPVGLGCGTTLKEDLSGRLWMGVDILVWRYIPDTQQWTRFGPPAPPSGSYFTYIHDLELDNSGMPWLALPLCSEAECTKGWVRYRINNRIWNQIGDEALATPRPMENSLAFDTRGNTWFFEASGIYRWNGNQSTLVASLDASSIIQEEDGKIWFIAPHQGLWLWAIE